MDKLQLTVLKKIWKKPRYIQSDFARVFDTQFAALASRGFITSMDEDHEATRIWRVTFSGMLMLTLLDPEGSYS